MTEKEPFYLTTAIAYVNAPPHIGFALELLYADVLARYQRLCGKDVKFLTGTDEHGQKIARKAQEKGLMPLEFTNEISELFRVLTLRLGISHSDFIRTTEDRHHRTVAEFWKRVIENGAKDAVRGPYIYKKTYGGLYCVGCESFKTEKDLVDGMCPDHHIAPEYIEEENYFFKLSAFAEDLKRLYASRPDFVVPETRFNEMKQLVEGGLEDMSISRSTKQLTWGIPVPGDDTQVIYVWFDALVNYLSAIGFGNGEDWKRYWPADIHIIGKEINRFHTVLWPAMLMAAGLEVPKQVGVHGWITANGQKMSKSLGNVIEAEQLLGEYGLDATRYLLLRYVPFRGDGDYTPERFMESYTADLANGLGNLVNRLTSMTEKYFGGILTHAASGDMHAAWIEYQTLMSELRFDQALETIAKVIRELNQAIDQEKPWALAKNGEMEKLGELLYRWLEQVRHIAWMLRPFMPETSEKVLDQLHVEKEIRDELTIATVSMWGGLRVGEKIEVGAVLFPRRDDIKK